MNPVARLLSAQAHDRPNIMRAIAIIKRFRSTLQEASRARHAGFTRSIAAAQFTTEHLNFWGTADLFNAFYQAVLPVESKQAH